MKGTGIGPAERSGGRFVTIDPIARRFRLDGCDGGSAEMTFHYNGATEDRGRRPNAFSEFTRQRVQNTRRQRAGIEPVPGSRRWRRAGVAPRFHVDNPAGISGALSAVVNAVERIPSRLSPRFGPLSTSRSASFLGRSSRF